MGNEPTSTGERPASKTKEEVIREAKRIEESLLYSSKAHFSAARFWGKFHLWIGIPIVLMASIAGAAALTRFDPEHVIAGVFSIIVAALSAVATFLNPNEKVSAHMNSGNSYDALMNTVRIFRVIDCWRDESDQVLTERIKYYSEQKDELNRRCPPISQWAYRKGKKSIVRGEATFEVDKK